MASEPSLEFHPEALAELERAKAWYEAQRLGHGESFFQEITTAISQIREAPNAGRNIKEERHASSCIASPLRSSMVNARPVSSSLP